ITALLFKVFGVHEQLQLVAPFATAAGLVWLTYAWGRRRFDGTVGFLSAWLVAVSPVLIMLTNTGLWADPPMVLCATFAPYAVLIWAEEQKPAWLVAGVFSLALSALLKLTGLYAALPIAFIFAKKYGPLGMFRAPVVWLSGLAAVVPSLAWYW